MAASAIHPHSRNGNAFFPAPGTRAGKGVFATGCGTHQRRSDEPNQRVVIQPSLMAATVGPHHHCRGLRHGWVGGRDRCQPVDSLGGRTPRPGRNPRPVGGPTGGFADPTLVSQWYTITNQTVTAAAFPRPVTQSDAWSVSWLAVARAVDAGFSPSFEEAAFAQALHDTLVAIVPSQQSELDADLSSTLTGIPNGPAKSGASPAASTRLRRRCPREPMTA